MKKNIFAGGTIFVLMDHSAREQDKKQHTRIAVLTPSLEKKVLFFLKKFVGNPDFCPIISAGRE